MVEAAWEIHHRQGRWRAPEIRHGARRRLAHHLPHRADCRRRRPLPFGNGHGERAVGQQAEAVGVAEADSQHIDRLPVGADPQEPLVRRREEVARCVAFEAALEVVPTRRLKAICHTGIEVGFAVAVRVVKPRELIAAEHIDDVVVYDEAEGLIEPGRHPPPADVLQVGVEARHPPHIPLDRADRGVTIREEAVPAEEHQRAPRVFKRRRDRIDGVGRASAGRARGRKHLGPLRRSSLYEARERMAFHRRDLADKLAILHPWGVEVVRVADRIGKNHPLSMAVEAVVDAGPIRQIDRGGQFAQPSRRAGRSEEAVPRFPKPEKAAFPDRLDLERVGIEAGGEFAGVAEPHTHRAGNRPTADGEWPCLHGALIAGVATGVIPGRPGDAAPVAVCAAIEPGPRRQQKRHRGAAAELQCLLRVGVVDAVLVYPQVTVRPVLRNKRFAGHIK